MYCTDLISFDCFLYNLLGLFNNISDMFLGDTVLASMMATFKFEMKQNFMYSTFVS